MLMLREARQGFPERCAPICDPLGEPIVYPSDEAAEKVAARLRRNPSLTPGTRLTAVTFVAGWLPQKEEK